MQFALQQGMLRPKEMGYWYIENLYSKFALHWLCHLSYILIILAVNVYLPSDLLLYYLLLYLGLSRALQGHRV